MRKKRILVKEAGLLDFFRSFFRAKSQGKEKEYISKMRKVSPELADAWSDWDSKADDLLITIKNNYLRMNMPDKAAKIDALIAKYK